MLFDNNDYVYFIRDHETGLIKIGRSKHPEDRRKSIQSKIGHKLAILATMATVDLEKRLHEKFDQYRVTGAVVVYSHHWWTPRLMEAES